MLTSMQNNGRKRAHAQLPLAGVELPHDLSVEKALIAGLLNDDDGSLFRRCMSAGLSEGAFYSPQFRELFRLACELRKVGAEVDSVTVCRTLHECGKLARFGGAADVIQIANAYITGANNSQLVTLLCDLEKRRTGMQAAAGMFEALKSGHAEAAEEWRARLAEPQSRRQGELPPLLNWSEFVDTPRARPDELISGLLHRGSKMMLGGGSKSFKTWALLDLALSVAAGVPWWGMPTKKAPVLFVNFELQIEFAQERVREIIAAKRITEAPLLFSWHLRGFARDLKELVPEMISRAAGIPFGMIVLDPIYKALGDRDENANGEVAQLLNEVEAVAVRTGAAIVFGHHFSKGNQAAKESRDRVSGAGSWTRDPDTLTTLTPHKVDDCFSVEFVLRNCKPRDAFVVRWKYPLMEMMPGLSANDLREPGRPKEHTDDKLLELLGSGLLTFREWADKANEAGVSLSSFKRLLAELKALGKVKQVGACYSQQ